MAESIAPRQRKRGGRKTKPPREKRSKQRNLRFTIAEDAAICRAAKALGVEVSEYIRDRTLKGRVRPRAYHRGVDPTLAVALDQAVLQFQQIRQLQTNQGDLMNQMARRCNSDGTDRQLAYEFSKWDHVPEVIRQNAANLDALIGETTALMERIILSAMDHD